jgi:hypothetical protein
VQLALFTTLVVAIGGVAFSSPASSAPASSSQNANRAVKALVRPGLVRAEIVTLSAGKVNDYRVDRGVVRKMRGRLLTLAERDGAVARVRLSSATQIGIDGRRSAAKRVRPGMRATAMRKGSAAASWLYVAKGSLDRSGAKIKSLLSTGFVRAEVVSQAGGELLDSRADTGVIESVDDTSLTLYESDGTTVQMRIDSNTQVQVNNKAAGTTDLATGMRATTIRSGEGAIGQIWASGKKSGGRKK